MLVMMMFLCLMMVDDDCLDDVKSTFVCFTFTSYISHPTRVRLVIYLYLVSYTPFLPSFFRRPLFSIPPSNLPPCITGCCCLHRRHLMVWAVFAPKFAFEGELISPLRFWTFHLYYTITINGGCATINTTIFS